MRRYTFHFIISVRTCKFENDTLNEVGHKNKSETGVSRENEEFTTTLEEFILAVEEERKGRQIKY